MWWKPWRKTKLLFFTCTQCHIVLNPRYPMIIVLNPLLYIFKYNIFKIFHVYMATWELAPSELTVIDISVSIWGSWQPPCAREDGATCIAEAASRPDTNPGLWHSLGTMLYIRLYNLMNPWIHYTIYKTVQHWALSCMIFNFCWDKLPLLWRSPNRLWVQHALLPLKLKPSLVFPGLNWVMFTANDCYHIIWYQQFQLFCCI